MSKPVHSRSYVPRLLFSFVVLTLAVLILLFRQEIIDKYHVLNYSPSAEMRTVVERSGFSEPGQYMFFASRPLLQDRSTFNDSCRSVATEQSAILGCYASQRIYLFDIDDQRLDGVKEVTAAHEMLHAVYDRMSFEEKQDVHVLLEAQAQSLGADQARIDELLLQYEETEPGQRLNELHSILGSEVANLSPALEKYYATYFDDRSILVARAQKYQSVFAELQQEQQTLVTELNGLADRIDAESAAYRRNLQVLEADIATFNRRAGSGSMARDVYDRERAILVERQQSLREEYVSIQQTISTYEAKRLQLAAINSESAALNRSINSSMTEPSESL